jgi:hypothetical protein
MRAVLPGRPAFLLIFISLLTFTGLRAQPAKCIVQEQKIIHRVNFLKATDYSSLFLRGMETLADSIWRLDSSRQILECIVAKSGVDNRSRFFAAEILFKHSDWKPEGQLKTNVALIYAEALKEDYTGVANPWGRPDDPGDIGRHLILLGDETIKAFYPLLTCNTPLIYAGSKVATMAKRYKYRVKDVAATYISILLGHSFEGDKKPFFRNFAIRKVKRAAKKKI